jgi:hypothetical protein
MKHLPILSCCLLILTISSAQNVGINDPIPTAKLTVKGAETTPDGQGAAIKLQNTAGNTNAWYLRAGGTGNNTPNGGFSIADNFGYHFTMGQGGNIGLGIAPSSAKLHLNGAMKIEGLNTVEFGAGLTKEINAGKIGYQTFTAGALDIVGAGTTVANRKVNIFAEGGTTFNGPINVSGSTGTTGQVLTSNSTASPSWENAAFNNNVRFEVDFNGNSTTLLLPPVTTTTIYNLDPAVVFIGPASFSVFRSGLYHIEGFYDIEHILNRAPTDVHYAVALKIGGRNYPILNGTEPYDRDFSSGTQFIYRKSVRFVNEVYISAPTGINFNVLSSFNLGPASFISGNHFGKISGYLISD